MGRAGLVLAGEIERREVAPRLPNLQGLIALHLAGQLSAHLPVGPDGKAKAILEVLPGRSVLPGTGGKSAQHHTIIAAPTGLPVSNGTIDFLLDSFDPGDHHPVSHRWAQACAALKLGGKGILVAAHPFGPLAPTPKANERVGFEDFFKFFRDSGIGIGNVREVFVDQALRRFFVGNDGQALFNRLKDSPLLIIFFISKIQVKTP